ncbi:GNAT family N-acetyltransferase [Actinoplanes sp. CA-030573]|uniref:GNAT family N-acetyltransferase n=1 Tax=Actinoplanes sp. CA-030573 TaxID=3239898 RepID=UPI003D941848
MTIAPLDPADAAAIDEWYDLVVAVTRHDLPDFPTPSRRAHVARFTHPWPHSTEEAILARDGAHIIGAASYQIPQNEDLSTLYLDLIVHPAHRRRGVGTNLLQAVEAAARRHHRTLIEVETVRALAGGPARDESGYRYLTARGHRPGMTSIRSRCELPVRGPLLCSPIGAAADHPSLCSPVRAAAAGYSLIQWRDAAPAELIDDLAALQTRLMLDAPTGTLSADQRSYDAARLRAQEATEQARGHRSYSTAARHDSTGRIVARTKLAFESAANTHARQRITLVEPAHRGHRLGMQIKSANHAYAQAHEPPLRFIDAWNADDNTHMRAVNTQLGFRPVDAWPAFQLSCGAQGT